MNELAEARQREEAARRRELAYLESPDEHLSRRQRRWLAPPGWGGRAVRAALYGVNWCGVHLLFRPQATGLEHVPQRGPYILAPNHASSLDPFVLSAVIGYDRVRQAVWAGRRGALLGSRVRRLVNRLAHAIPIQRNASALAVGAAALQRGRILVWFPEGHRAETGQLQPFKRGVGVLMDFFQVPAVPAFIRGAHEAMPPGARLPRRFPRIAVAFGPPVDPREFADEPDRDRRIERLVATLRQRVAALGESLSP